MTESNNQQKNNQFSQQSQNQPKSSHAEREEKILAFWKEKGIFEKSVKRNEGGKEFVFYEGPPTANGRPGIHHLEARAFKDAIPRYKTMRGFHVRRKGGWDTHGLPVELQVEKELGLKSKKDIEVYGIGAFNEKCKESVWKHVREWENFTERIGYWVDLKNPYITYKSSYIESLWNIVKTVEHKNLLYKDYKVVPWCPRCGTGLSSHELAQGYQDVKDLAVTVKFRVKPGQKIGDFVANDKTYILAWTTTPWTLPGNVGLAVGKEIEYVRIESGQEMYILAKDRMSAFGVQLQAGNVVETIKGANLTSLSYEPLYPFLRDNITGPEKEKLVNAYKVYPANFVTTTDGTGIVHTAVMYGQDDFELGTAVGLPKYHLVNDDGTFRKEAGFLAGAFVKDPNTDVAIIKDLAGRSDGSLLFHKEKYEHSYPSCWRCKTPLIYFARDSWYIRMSSLRGELIKENEGINWEPAHIKNGRFGEWLSEIKDWAISRERYWGTPLPVWICEKCQERKVIGSVAEIAGTPNNSYFIMRHGEADNNVKSVLNGNDRNICHLTEKGKQVVEKSAQGLKDVKIDFVYVSPFARAQESVKILQKIFGWKSEIIITDDRLREIDFGQFEGRSVADFAAEYPLEKRFLSMPPGAETYGEIKKRAGDILYELEQKNKGKNILIVTHATTAMMLLSAARGCDREQSILLEKEKYIDNAEIRKVDFAILPHNHEYELDLHRPYIDEIKLSCTCGGSMSRIKEVMDVWFDSGAMPFAQDHYPFREKIQDLGFRIYDQNVEMAEQGIFQSKSGLFKKIHGYPADFISEAIDQTRGWFYTLHAVGILMGVGKAFKNVICLGHILDGEGKKMSKSLGNIVDPWTMMNKYGADALRFWMYSVNQPGDSKNFEEKTVDEMVKKVFNLASNVLSFYQLYAGDLKLDDKETFDVKSSAKSGHVLDRWIVVRLDQVIGTVTNGLDNYVFLESTRAVRDFIGDLSQWYLRRSRDRFKGSNPLDKESALFTTRYILLTLSKIMAPFTPFFADYIYREVGGRLESVHLETWPTMKQDEKDNKSLISDMEIVRSICSKGLEARMSAKINVRQPLSVLRVKKNLADKLPDEFVELIKDEVNVKSVIFGVEIDKDVELDLAITPELKEEGMVRELVRAIQDARKAKGLSVNDKAVLTIETDETGQQFIEKNKKQLMNVCLISDMKFGTVVATVETIVVGDVSLKLGL